MTLGADLLILAVDAPQGTVRMPNKLGFALAAAELVDLASARRIEAADGHIHVTEQLRTGDPVLDETLQRLTGDPKGAAIDNWIAMQAPDRVQVHIAALLESGELSGKPVPTRLNAPPKPHGLRVADPRRRAALAEKLVDVARHEVELEDDAFGALAHAAGLPEHVVTGMTKHRVANRLKDLAGWFTDTSRYLPGSSQELALGVDDVEPGGINPVDEEPYRLLIRLAVQEAVRRAEARQRNNRRPPENGLSKDVQNAIALVYDIEKHL
jgi:hypothetical protein